MKSPFTLSADLNFAVFGDCFARSIENSLRKSGISVISSEINRGMRLCCTNPVWDSSHEASVVAGIHEQTYTPDLQDQELASLQ